MIGGSMVKALVLYMKSKEVPGSTKGWNLCSVVPNSTPQHLISNFN